MGRSMKPGKQTWIWLLSLLLLGAMATASAVDSDEDGSANQIDSATIEQAMGVDQNVDYAELRRFGPWDDRNYALTEADVALLPENDEFRHGVPAFSRRLPSDPATGRSGLGSRSGNGNLRTAVING